MFCEHCGNMLPESAKFCDSCGAPVAKKAAPVSGAPKQEPYTAPMYPQPYGQMNGYSAPQSGPKPPVGFGDAIRLYFQNYANFSGRARRSEYWFASLFVSLVNLVVGMMIPDLAWIVTLALLVPNLSIAIRRLHDIGKSGWWYLIAFVPLVGGIWLLVYLCRDSEGNNQWGASPKY